MRDDNGPLLRHRREQWVEPLWKSVLSNKGLMPLLWRYYPNHPNLLPAWFEGDSKVKRQKLHPAKAMYANRYFPVRGATSPFLMVSSRLLNMLMATTQKNR